MADLATMFITPSATLRDAMQSIDATGLAIALIVDADRTLQGTITDGDIRRALLGGADLDAPAAQHAATKPYVVTSSAPHDYVLDVMRARGIMHVPICDDKGRVTGLHALREWLGASVLANTAVLMAGGRGTRLGPLTDEIPKPMINVAGRPILEWQILHLMNAGIREIALAVNYRSAVIKDHFGDGDWLGCVISYLEEEPSEPLGTAGALALLADRVGVPQAPVLVMNGDLMTRFSVEGLLARHASSAAVATVAVHEYRHQVPFGVVRIDETGHSVTAIEEKPTVSWPVNAGIYVLEPAVIARMSPGRRDVTDLLAECISNGETVSHWLLEDEWIDIGQPPDLRRARGQ